MDALESVVASGDVRRSLEAVRDVLASRLAGAEPRESAALAKALAELVLKLDALPGEEKSDLDDLADRRLRRRAEVPDDAGVVVERGKRGK